MTHPERVLGDQGVAQLLGTELGVLLAQPVHVGAGLGGQAGIDDPANDEVAVTIELLVKCAAVDCFGHAPTLRSHRRGDAADLRRLSDEERMVRRW